MTADGCPTTSTDDTTQQPDTGTDDGQDTDTGTTDSQTLDERIAEVWISVWTALFGGL